MARHRSLGPGSSSRPKKSLGQHFLTDATVIEKIVSLAGFRSADVVLEIGPGKGALTLPLSKNVSHVIAVEKDTRLANMLEKRLSGLGISNVTLVNQDILSFDLSQINSHNPGKIEIIGNLPYNISSPLLGKLTKDRKHVARAILMFQLEVAERLTASPATKAYGAMTLLVQYYARPTRLLKVSRNAFYPVPKVDSMIVELDFEQPYPNRSVDDNTFRKVVKMAFAHRRKTIMNSMKGASHSWTHEALMKGMMSCGIHPKTRAETLDIDAFLCLSSALPLTNREKDDIK